MKASDVTQAAGEIHVSVERLKRYSTLGMGTAIFRPPYTKTGMGAIAQHRVGALAMHHAA